MEAKRQPTLRDNLDDLDMALGHMSGVLAGLAIMHEEMDMQAASPTSSAFWALVSGGEHFVREGQECSKAIHQKTKEMRI